MNFSIFELADIAEYAVMEGLTFDVAACFFLYMGHRAVIAGLLSERSPA